MANISNIKSYQAILFVINTMVGSGVFLNTILLIDSLKNYSFLIYIITAIIISPLIITCYSIAKEFPGKNIQEIFSSISENFGRQFAWCYSIGKLSTSAIATVFASKLLSEIFLINSNFIFLMILMLFIFLNSRNVKFNSLIQWIIFFCKIIPIFFIIYISIFNFEKSLLNFNFVENNIQIKNIISSIIMTIFSFAGFESLFAIASKVNNAEKNTSKVIAIGFLSVTILYSLYEFFISKIAYKFLLLEKISFIEIIKRIIENSYGNFTYKFIMMLIAISVSGLAYSVMYANIKNLLNIFYKKIDDSENNKNMTIFTATIIAIYGGIFFDNLKYLQQLAAFTTIVTYIIFSLIYYKKFFYKNFKGKIFSILAFISSTAIMISVIYNSFLIGYIAYLIYAFIFLLGAIIFRASKK